MEYGYDGSSSPIPARSNLIQRLRAAGGRSLSIARVLVVLLVFAVGLAVGVGGTVWLVESGLASRIEARASAWWAAQKPKSDIVNLEWRRVETSLLGVDVAEIPLGGMDGPMATGGSIAALGGGLVISTARGRLGFLDLTSGALSYSALRVPMNEQGLDEIGAREHALFSPPKFRVNDILLTRTATGRRVLLANHHVVEGRRICTAVSSIGVGVEDGQPVYVGAWKRIYTVRPCLDMDELNFHFEGHKSGGRMVADRPGRITMVVGDYGLGGAHLDMGEKIIARDDWDLTRILEIDIETGEASELARGVRSPAALLRDSRGRLWETESGPQGGDELNLIRPGGHYGWPSVSYGTSYGDGLAPRRPLRLNPEQGRHDGYDAPVMAFTPAIAPSQMVEVASDSGTFAAWRGDLLMGSLRGQSLYRLRLEADRVIYAEPIKLGYRLRDLEWLPDGRLAVMADENRLLVVRDAHVGARPDGIRIAGYDQVRELAPAPNLSDSAWKRELFTDRCGACHALGGGESVGPSLAGVIGRPIGAERGYPYSPDLADAKGRWTLERLEKFVRDPAAAGFPGSHMPPIAEVDDDVYLHGIIDFADSPEF